jgi:hypothetical protein
LGESLPKARKQGNPKYNAHVLFSGVPVLASTFQYLARTMNSSLPLDLAEESSIRLCCTG